MGKKEREQLGLLTIAEIARESGVAKSTVRYYTEVGLLDVAGTFSPKNYRLYNREEVIARIQQIRKIQLQNRTLSDIREEVRFA